MEVQDCMFFQLTKASLAGNGFWTKKVEHLGVTAPQAMALNFLGEEDRILSLVLRQKLQITSATMTGILDRLEKIGLIERQPHPGDRRAILVCLTDKGACMPRILIRSWWQPMRSLWGDSIPMIHGSFATCLNGYRKICKLKGGMDERGHHL